MDVQAPTPPAGLPLWGRGFQRGFQRHQNHINHVRVTTDGGNYLTCCRTKVPPLPPATREVAYPTCLHCLNCRGCAACDAARVVPATTYLGPWITADRRALYPFEMDPPHIRNAVKKLHREQHHFRENWQAWIAVFIEELILRQT